MKDLRKKIILCGLSALMVTGAVSGCSFIDSLTGNTTTSETSATPSETTETTVFELSEAEDSVKALIRKNDVAAGMPDEYYDLIVYTLDSQYDGNSYVTTVTCSYPDLDNAALLAMTDTSAMASIHKEALLKVVKGQERLPEDQKAIEDAYFKVLYEKAQTCSRKEIVFEVVSFKENDGSVTSETDHTPAFKKPEYPAALYTDPVTVEAMRMLHDEGRITDEEYRLFTGEPEPSGRSDVYFTRRSDHSDFFDAYVHSKPDQVDVEIMTLGFYSESTVFRYSVTKNGEPFMESTVNPSGELLDRLHIMLPPEDGLYVVKVFDVDGQAELCTVNVSVGICAHNVRESADTGETGGIYQAGSEPVFRYSFIRKDGERGFVLSVVLMDEYIPGQDLHYDIYIDGVPFEQKTFRFAAGSTDTVDIDYDFTDDLVQEGGKCTIMLFDPRDDSFLAEFFVDIAPSAPVEDVI